MSARISYSLTYRVSTIHFIVQVVFEVLGMYPSGRKVDEFCKMETIWKQLAHCILSSICLQKVYLLFGYGRVVYSGAGKHPSPHDKKLPAPLHARCGGSHVTPGSCSCWRLAKLISSYLTVIRKSRDPWRK